MSDGLENKFNYQVTLQTAQQRFTQLDIETIAIRSGAQLSPTRDLVLNFLARVYIIGPHGDVAWRDSSEPVPIAEKILLLHYLAQAQGAQVQNKLISFKELPGGSIYIGPFTNRAIRPLVAAFGANPKGLLDVSCTIGGEVAQPGDVSVCIKVLPYVPVTLVLWEGDDEFPASGNILFDASAPYFLPTEDYAVLASMLVAFLKKQTQQA